MGLIREPKGVDLIIGPSILTEQDRQMISKIIAAYKHTGKLPLKTGKIAYRKRKRISGNKDTIMR